jgi:hypothetical protein
MNPLTPTQKTILRFLNEERARVYAPVTRAVFVTTPGTRGATERAVYVPHHAWDRLEIAQITVAVEARNWQRHPNLDDARVAAFIATL